MSSREEPPATSGRDAEHRFPCAQCGASLRYAPGQTRLKCTYCGHEQAIPAADAAERGTALRPLDYRATLAGPLPPAQMEETRVLSCPNCGAQVQFDPAIHAAECPFCATPIVTDTGTHRHIKPQALIPFMLTEDEARAAMRKWLGRLWFAPNGLQQYARQGRPLTGLYVPYWSFDADTDTRYRGQRGTYYYVTRTRTVMVDGKPQTRTEQVRKTRWVPVSGRVARRFDDVLVMAAQSLPRPYMRALEPWILGALEPYRPDFLSGFRAEGYTVGLEQGHGIALERMDEVIRSDIRRDIGGDEQRITSVDTRHWDETFKHLLLPIWMAAYRYRDRSYRFMVNAQSGKVQGERPWSWIKIALAAIAAAVVIGLVIYFTEYH